MSAALLVLAAWLLPAVIVGVLIVRDVRSDPRLVEDREVEMLDAAWMLPAHDEGVHAP
jgi:hypothetical protein